MSDEAGGIGGRSADSADERAERMRIEKEGVVLSTLRAKLSGLDLRDTAAAIGVAYDEKHGTVELHLLTDVFWVDDNLEVRGAGGQPEFEDTAIILNALRQRGGRRGEGWKAFRELASGHAGDFRDEAERPLAEVAAEVAADPREAAYAVGGSVVEPIAGSDVTIRVPVYPNVEALVQVFAEDMEFPSDARILFSEGADNFLPPGCLEELGARLAARMRRAVES